MKKILSIVMTLILLWGLAMPAAAAEAAVGSTLRLEKTEGTVTVKNASGKSLTLKNGMRLYSGSKIKTDKESYAYISLDNGKAVKLGASSEGEVRKSGKKLELKVLSGELFFDVSVPLENDESLNIRTSTMVTGVRGTVGYVVVRDRYHSEVCLLEGRLTVTGTDEVSGGIRTTEITAGQKATTVMQQTTQGEQVQLTVEPLKEREVPGFVAVAVAQDTTLQKRIETKSTLNVQEIIKDAQNRLETEQKEAAKEAEEVQRQVEQQAKETQQNQPEQVFTPSSESSGGGGGSSYVPPAEVQLSGDVSPDALAAALAGDSPTVVMSSGARLTVNGETTIPAGKTLKLDGATMNIGSASEVSGLQDIGEVEPLNDGAGPQFVVASGGRLELTNGATLNVNDGSGLDVAGILDLNSGAQMNIIQGGDRFGAMEVTGTVNVNAGAALQNGGSIAILSKNSIHVRGEMVNNGEILIGNSDSQGLLAVEDGGRMTNSGWVELTGDSSLTNAGSFTMSEGKIADSARIIAEIGTAITNSGTAAISGGEVTGGSCGIANTGNLTVSGSAQIAAGAGTAITNSGTVTISGGTVTGAGCAIKNMNLLQISNGEIDGEESVAMISATDGTAITNSRTATISGGIVTGANCAIDNTGSLEINGAATVKVTASAGGSASDNQVIKGSFTWTGGSLMAQDRVYFPAYSGGPAEITGPEDNYYTATFSGWERNLMGSDLVTLQAALNIEHVTTVNLDLSGNENGFALPSDVTVHGNKTLNIKKGTLVVPERKTFAVSGGTVNFDSSSLIATQGGTVNVTGGAVNAAWTAISNSGSGTVNVSGGTVEAGSIAIYNTASTVKMTGGTVKATGTANTDGTAISAAGGTVHVTGGTVSADGTAISGGEKTMISGGTVSGGTCAVDNSSNGTLSISENAVVQVTAEKGGSASVINGSFTWTGGKLMAKDSSYFPQNIALPALTGPDSDGFYVADYASKVRNLPSNADIDQLAAALALTDVTEVNLNSDLTVSEDVTITEGKTLNINTGTLSINNDVTLSVDGSVNIKAIDSNDTGGIQNNGVVKVQNTGKLRCEGRFTNGAYTISKATLSISTKAQGTESVRIAGTGGNFTNYGTVDNSSRFTVEAAAHFQNNNAFNNLAGGQFSDEANNDSGNRGECTNSGTFTNSGSVAVHVVFTNSSNFINENSGSVANSGTFENHGGFSNRNTVTGTGTFTNGTAEGSAVETYFANNSSFTCGTFNNYAPFNNSGTFICNTAFNNYYVPKAATTLAEEDSASEPLPATNNGTFNNNGVFTNSGAFTNSAGATFFNRIENTTDVTFTNTGIFTNNGTFENHGKASLVEKSTFTNSSTGVFNNLNEHFMPNTTFWSTGVYTDSKQVDMCVMVKDTQSGQVRLFSTIGTWERKWAEGTTVTLYGSQPVCTIKSDTDPFLNVNADSVILDLNGKKIDLDGNALTVSGNLTIKDSSATEGGDGTDGTGVLTSSNTTATVIVTDTGKCTLVSGTIQNTKGGAAVM